MDSLIPDSQLIFFFQLFVAMILGMLLGAERTIAGKTAGMRTYALVSMGSCLLIIISTIMTGALITVTNVDPLRVMASIVTGIGFIGAGIIIFKESTLKGLTTAAGLWVAAAIGIAVGYQLYLLALFATLLTLFVFTILWFLRHHLRVFYKRNGQTEVVEESPEDDEKELL